MKRISRGVFQLIPLLIVALLLIVGVGYYVYTTGQVKPIDKTTTSPTPTISQPSNGGPDELRDDETLMGWKRYINKENRYSISYPNDIFIRSICTGTELVLEIREANSTKVPACARGGRFALEIITYDVSKGEKPWTDYSEYKIIEKDVVVEGISTKVKTYSYVDPEYPEEPTLNDWISTVLINKGDKIYEITLSVPEFLEVFDKILSTFQFLE